VIVAEYFRLTDVHLSVFRPEARLFRELLRTTWSTGGNGTPGLSEVVPLNPRPAITVNLFHPRSELE
jgi:hypothetical protein